MCMCCRCRFVSADLSVIMFVRQLLLIPGCVLVDVKEQHLGVEYIPLCT